MNVNCVQVGMSLTDVQIPALFAGHVYYSRFSTGEERLY
jgi:hypothetical protein